MQPIIETAERILQYEGVAAADLVVPMTHQYMPDKKAFARYFGNRFPVVPGVVVYLTCSV